MAAVDRETRPARKALFVAAGVLLFVGLRVLGWGVPDLAGFFANPARALYAVLTVVISLWIVLTIPSAGRSHGRGHRTIERQHVALILLQLLSIAIVILGPYCDRRAIGVFAGVEAIRYAGLAAYAGGFVLMGIAAAALGRHFSTEITIQENHRLITKSLYRVIRHPRYTGIIAVFLGISLVFRSELALLLTVVAMAVLLWRIHDEEALLKSEFGSEWEQYAKTTWRLLPYIF